MGKSRNPLAFFLILLVVGISSLNLRAGIASVAPVLAQIRENFGISPATVGVLTALPGFVFAIMGWCAVPIARRSGLSLTVFVGGIAMLIGLALRPWTGSFAGFLALTLLLVSGMAVANIVLPAWIKQHGRVSQMVVLMTLYTSVLGLSSALGPLSAVVMPTWRGSLAVWAIPVGIALLVWLAVLPRTWGDIPHAPLGDAGPSVPIIKSPTAVAMLLFFGLQSTMAYVQMGWLPQMLMDKGVSQSTASLALALIGALNIVGGILMPWLIERLNNLRPVPIFLALCTASGWGGMLVDAAGAPLLWAGLMGVGGMCFPLAIALLAARTRTAVMTARLSGFVQPGGYVLAGVVPLVLGALNSWSGNWTVPLVVLIILSFAMLGASLGATRSVFIDDELNGR